MLAKWHGRYISQNTWWNIYIHMYMDKSCIHRHHVSKDFCTPVINEVCSGSQEEKFWDRTRAQNNVSYCSLLLQIRTITVTLRYSHHFPMTYSRMDLKIICTILYIAVALAEAYAVIINLTFIQGNFWYNISF